MTAGAKRGAPLFAPASDYKKRAVPAVPLFAPFLDYCCDVVVFVTLRELVMNFAMSFFSALCADGRM